MSRQKKFRAFLTDRDVVDFRLDVDAGRVVGFTVNYRAHIEGNWHEVMRYDTVHGHLHVHRFWLPRDEEVVDLEDPSRPSPDYNARLDAAEADLRRNWRTYRRRVEARLS